MVCEKKKYFLLGISASTGTSFTPKSTSQSDKSLTTAMPAALYWLSEKILIDEFSTTTSTFLCSDFNLTNSSGVNTVRRSGGFFRS